MLTGKQTPTQQKYVKPQTIEETHATHGNTTTKPKGSDRFTSVEGIMKDIEAKFRIRELAF